MSDEAFLRRLIVLHGIRHAALFHNLESVKGIRPLLDSFFAFGIAGVFGLLCSGRLLFRDL